MISHSINFRVQIRPLIVTRVHKAALQTRRIVLLQAFEQTNPELANLPEPEDARGAISVGLRLTEAGEWERALGYFEKALELPGTGIKRFRDKPPAISNGEKIACLYNIACCLSQQGGDDNISNGLVAIAGVLEAGYDDFGQLRNDPHLANIRTNEKFEGLLGRFERKNGGFMGLFRNL